MGEAEQIAELKQEVAALRAALADALALIERQQQRITALEAQLADAKAELEALRESMMYSPRWRG